MEVGWQNEGDALQPVHHSYGLWLPGICDGGELVWEVAIEIKIVAVVASSVALDIACEEINDKHESSAAVFM